jgi:hypothetical protein
MPTAGGYFLCIEELGFCLSVWKRIGIQAGCGDHYVPSTNISSPPRCHMSSSSPEHRAVRSPSEICTRIKKLGYIVGKHMNLYGEHMEMVSDPFVEGDGVAVQAISSSSPTVRTIELPVSVLAGWEDLFQELANPTASELTAKTRLPGSAGTQ